MDNINTMAMFQAGALLIEKYGFSEQIIREYAELIDREMWLTNLNDPNYQLIRVTTVPVSSFEEDRNRVDIVYHSFSIFAKRKISFLDIHIDDHPYSDLENYDHLNLYFNGFAEGKDVHDFYPELYSVLVEESDAQSEIEKQMKIIDDIEKGREKKRSFFARDYSYVTYGLMIACTIVYLISFFLERKYAESAVLVFLGGDYKTFTLGLHQFYRLITCAFVHGGLLHLVSNMYSLYILGSYLEKRMGRLNYAISLLIGTLTASLSQGILTENTITVGMSGGIYALLVIFAFDLIRLRIVPLRSFIPLIVINGMINLLDTTAWIAHIGGLVAGIALYYFFFSKDKIGLGVLIGAMLLSLFVKYVTIKEITPIYGGTDLEVVQIFKDLGLKDYALSLMRRLAQVYARYGG